MSIGRVLSDPSADQIFFDSPSESNLGNSLVDRAPETQKTGDVRHMVDLSLECDVEASSRQAMVVCLTDGSPETFWECGEEDKSRARALTLTFRGNGTTPVLLAIFFDNVRDEMFRTNAVQIRAMLPDGSKRNLHTQQLDVQFVGWVKACVFGAQQAQIILRGPYPAQRIRQAFSDEMAEEQHGTLRQRVIDLLFSRVQLQPLQTHVCTQIANALEREVISLRDRGKRNYSYACGLMHILTRICASRKGTEVFSARNYLLLTLSELLLFSPQVVQCQILETIEKLLGVFSPSQTTKGNDPEPFCENHDDGRTLAQVYCEVCRSNLCRDCFSILHLNKKNRSHEVRLLGSSNSAPQVEIHDGCSRLRLPNMLVLFHGQTLNGLVELSVDPLFPTGSSFHNRPLASQNPSASTHLPSNKCRFCEAPLSGETQVLEGVCGHTECQEFNRIACQKSLPCGHRCCGIAGEESCLECMQCPREGTSQDGDDVCVICFTDRLGAAPCIKIECGHIFHYACVRAVLEKRWNGPRILFRFMNCPLCNGEMEHPGIRDLIEPLKALKTEVLQKSKLRLEYDGMMDCQAVVSPNSEFYNQPEAYAMERYVYVQCHKCSKAYFGGESRCQLPLDSSQYNPAELICGGCSDVTGAQICGRHGVEYLEYKCRYCCSIAVYFCFGTTHFCASCHDDFQRLVSLPKHLLPKCPAGPRATQLEDAAGCPLKLEHPATGEEFAIGCGICRNLSTF
ncbi:unnamed protein product, partial [Mesorhabditis spiculigera]